VSRAKTGNSPAVPGVPSLEVDPFHAASIPARLREPLRAALRGERAAWPEDLSDGEAQSLVDHGLAPLIHSVQPLAALRAAAIRAATVEPLRAEDLRLVLRELASRGIEVLLTKGTALAYDLYTKPEHRPRADVDLLISREDVPRAIETFRAMGFDVPETSGDEHAVRQVALSRTDAFGLQHHYDLHWAVTNTPLFATALGFEESRPRAIPIAALGSDARGLDDADALLLACIHRVAHHHDTERLIWLVDIALLSRRMQAEDRRRFWTQASAAGVIGVCVRSLALAEEWMPGAGFRPEEWLSAEELGRDEPSRAYLDRDLTYGRTMAADFRALSWRQRVQRAWQLAFPPAAFIQQSFGTTNRLILPWLYVRRGARGVVRLFRRA